MTRNRLDGLLRDWGYELSKQLQESGYPSSDTTTRIGVGSRAFGGVLVRDSWAYPDLAKLNIAICALPQDQRNMIIGKHVFCAKTYKELGVVCECSLSTAWRKYLEAEQALKKTVNRWRISSENKKAAFSGVERA